MPPGAFHPPRMTEVSQYDTARSPGDTQYPHQYLPRSQAPPQQPPRAHVQPHLYNNAPDYPYERRQASGSPGSVSSGTTASSLSSTNKARLPPASSYPYRYLAHAEKGLMGDGRDSIIGQQTAHYHGSRSQTMSMGEQSTTANSRAIYRYMRESEERDEEAYHAIWILMWLSFLDPLFSLFSAIFTIVVVAAVLLMSPLRLCTSSYSISISMIRAIAPVFRNHLRLLCSPSVDNAHTFDFNLVMLVLIHLVSPLLSIGVAVAAWISAAFWGFALIMGNPDGTERRDDGRAAVLGVRNWWERFFLHAIQ